MDPESGRTLEAGRTLGHYRLLERIGAGGMGEVWRSRDERLERDVALKVLLPGMITDDSARKRFRREALALSKLSHPNIATVFDFASEAGQDYLVMEYVGGATLGAHRGEGPLSETEVVRLGLQLAEGLAAAHTEGIVHRDLKPANVRLTADGRLKILDFGLAHLARPAGDGAGSAAPTQSASMTEAGALVGTLGYMAPEQVRGEKADARTDLWAAGLVLYELATGRAAYAQAETAPLLHAILNESVAAPRKVNPRLSPALEAIILKCVEKEPAGRYASARALAADLQRLQGGQSVAAERARTHARRLRTLAVAGPIAVVAILVALTALDVGGIRTRLFAPPPIRSIAVLPLSNLSGDPEQEYFADGMTEALINDLGQVAALRIISRTTAMQYKGTKKGLKEIAKELNVEAVVEGSVVRAGGRVKISAQLINATKDLTVWAQSYDRELSNVLVLQSDVARAITQQVRVRLTPEERTRLTVARTVDPRAHEAYLRGLQAMALFDTSARTALKFFEQAVALDPAYALAYVGMANAYDALADISIPPALAVPRARAAALKALQIDSLLCDAHVMLGEIEFNWDWDWVGAEREFKRAIELNPSSEGARTNYAMWLRCTGQYQRDVEQTRLAQDLAPLDNFIAVQMGFAHYYGRNYGEARREFEEWLRVVPDLPQAQVGLGLTLEQVGDHAAAIERLRVARALLPNDDYACAIVHALGTAGRQSEAHALLDSLIREHSSKSPIAGFPAAIAYVGLGERERAFEELARTPREPAGGSAFIKVDPRLDPLRSDPRFKAILRRVGLTR